MKSLHLPMIISSQICAFQISPPSRTHQYHRTAFINLVQIRSQYLNFPTTDVKLQMASSSSSSSSRPQSSYSSRGSSSPPSRQHPGKTSSNRNRGANAANHNRWGHSFRLNNKDEVENGRGNGSGGGKRVRKANTKRSPRWEREGDKLYAEVSKQLAGLDDGDDESEGVARLKSVADTHISCVQDVHNVLKPWMARDDRTVGTQNGAKKEEEIIQLLDEADSQISASTTTDNADTEAPKKSPSFLWGTLPVGPVLASRLYASERPTPTAVQLSAFKIITAAGSKNNKKVPTRRSNAIIASPTGTGKTLAYLLPLLATSPGGQHGEGTGGVLIVTPTIELACQIQREVDALWPPSETEDARSSLFAVGADDFNDGSASDSEDEDDDDTDEQASSDKIPPGRVILRSIQQAPIIAGTPKMLRMLYKEAERISRFSRVDTTITREELATSRALLSNLRAIVLDEADRLLRTEAVARETAERKERKLSQRVLEEAESLALDNYTPLPPKPKKRKLIVARQTQTELLLRDLPIPSLDNVQIVCASATVGRTMRRQLMQILGATSADAAATLVVGEEDARVKSKNAEKRKSVLLPEKLQHSFCVVDIDSVGDEMLSDEQSEMSVAEKNEERMIQATIRALWNTMTSMEEAKPIIVFPGKIGVDRVQRELLARGLEDVRTLRNLDGLSPEADIQVDMLQMNDEHDWKSIPVYIIGERFARGLDLADVGYVFLLTPPSSAAGYAHMAGRTGRRGLEGMAITLVRPKNNEVQRFAAIAEALGLKFAPSLATLPDVLGEDRDHDLNSRVEIETESKVTHPWANLSESSLKRKKNSELLDYLTNYGVESESSMKADLVAAIQKLHSQD